MPRPVVARPEEIRPRNLSTILTLLHEEGEMTRAQLTSRLGISRSAAGRMLTALASTGLLVESEPRTPTGAGRPSPVLGPRRDGPYVVAIDLDINQVVVAAVSLGGQIMERHTTALPSREVSPGHVVAAIAAAYAELAARLPRNTWPLGIGISVPGTVRTANDEILIAPNLGWRHVLLGPAIQTALDTSLPVHIGNDADLGAMAEHIRGAARGVSDVLFVNGRVGVGGGIITGGRAMQGAGGLAGEIGHMTVDPAGALCHCGNRGCFETLVGEAVILKAAGRRPRAGSGTEAIAEVVAAADDGDEQARTALTTASRALGQGLASLASILNPAVIIIGGSLAHLGQTHLSHIQSAFDQSMKTLPADQVRILPPDLGNDSPLIGASELAFAPLLRDPHAILDPAGLVGGHGGRARLQDAGAQTA